MGVDPVPEHAESMGTYQYAFANPVMFNDPLGDQGGDYYQNPTGSGSGGAQAVYFHGGYRRIGSGSGNWSDGINLRDWNAWTGSDTYRASIAAGARDIGGNLYFKNDDGSLSPLDFTGGKYGYYKKMSSSVIWETREEVGTDGVKRTMTQGIPVIRPSQVWITIGEYGMLFSQWKYPVISELQNISRPGFDIDKAVSVLNENAQLKPCGYCARYVRYALQAGGIDMATRPGSAKDYDKYLPKKGFRTISADGYKPITGDIVVMGAFTGERNTYPHGHIQMFNGERWMSDFRQRDFWPGNEYRNFKPNFTILRW